MNSLPLMQAEAARDKARLKELATVLDTRSLTVDEEKEVDATKAKLTDLSSKIERAQYLQQLAAEKAPTNRDERDFATRSKEFSLSKIIAKVNGKKVDTGSEDEISQELKSDGISTGEWVMPWTALETREITVSTANDSANNLTDDDYRPGMLIPFLRNQLVTGQLGATMIMGATGRIVIPRQKTTGGVSWLAEAGTVAGSDASWESITMDFHKLMALTGFTAQASIETQPQIETLARQDLMLRISHELDRVALYGSGASNQPSGITKLVSATSRSGDTNGKALNYKDCLDLPAALDTNNVMMGRRAFLCNPKTQYALMQVRQFSSDTSETVWRNGGIAGMTTAVSNVVKSNNTKGSATNKASDLFYGNWSDLIIATFGSGVSLDTDMYTKFTSGGVQLRAMVFADVALRYANSFVRYDSVLTA